MALELIHVRLQQRNGKKVLTTVQGISTDYNLKKILKAFKKEFACNGCIVEHKENHLMHAAIMQEEKIGRVLL